ncbi:MAG: nucleotidyl transferase AbiEii/AbiGii toxin family protein [Desulfarculaceae bacterium]|nr:nucleotidyl transferase AbiEii/AbiGii toxin family protein [Desulfarculaceae bacterium]MCF8102882.1 nucleotidyl transferase AbiEii/AbiGii toxin family protein [Desulfarculaceae bacterium]MCF8118464.1 nucleotidyl transferase AbiEii/AbiGii toxin family protein [Desulfarculaceae bacterium]
MSRAQVKDMAASVRQRLLNLSRERGENYQLLLTRYALERFLYRLSISRHANSLVLKGAFRLMAWTDEAHRPTRDLDFTGTGDESPENLGKIISDICWVESAPDDGLRFDAGMVQIEAIREDQVYQGLRAKFIAHLGSIPISVQVDVGFGDVVTPGPEEIDYPTLLDQPAPRIKAYPKESVVAEKLQAMVAIGMPTSRMKDFYDIWTMARVFPFDGSILVQAITNTFQRRRTPLPADIPTALSDEFAQDAGKASQWEAFVKRNQLETGGAELSEVIVSMREFLLLPLHAAAADRQLEFTWPAGGPWQ